jgi:hypothetical protein
METSFQKERYEIASFERQRHVDTILSSRAYKKLVVAGPGTGKTNLFKTILNGKNNTLTLTFVNALVADLSLELYVTPTFNTIGFPGVQITT